MTDMAVENLRKIIGQNIIKRREELNLTQTQLSTIAGIAEMTISKLERFVSIPGADTLLKLSQALQTDINYFYSGTTPLTLTEADNLLILYKSLSSDKQNNLLEYAQYLVKNKK
jgi:transcriptional regulator with XRE-family HTH domain